MMNRTTRCMFVPAVFGTLLVTGCWSTRPKVPSYTPAMGASPTSIPLTPVAQDTRPRRAETLWTCPMHSQVTAEQPGKCPICGMDLVRMGYEESAGGSHSGHSRSGSAGSGHAHSSGHGCCG